MPFMNLQQFSRLRKPQYGMIIGIPTMGVERVEFNMAMHSAGFPLNCVSQVIPLMGRTVAEARNLITHMAKEANARYLLFIDEDVIIPPNAIRRLIWNMENNLHITVCAGLYPSKSDPPMPLLFDEPGMGPSYDWHKGDIRKTWAVGMGITVIRLADLKKVDEIVPAVRVADFPDVGRYTECKEYFKDGSAWIEDKDALSGGWALTLTEDLWFCTMVREAGLKVYCDTAILCSHIDLEGHQTTIDMCRPFVPKIGEGKPVYLDMGCGPLYRKMDDGTPFLRVDLDPLNKPDYCQDVRQLDFKDGVADGILASHVLEHLSRKDAELALDEWVRVLKPGGWLEVGTPDIAAVAEYYVNTAKECNDDVLRNIFGGQTDEFQYHKSGWDEPTLRKAFERRGLEVTKVQHLPEYLSMEIWGKKCESTSIPSVGTNGSASPTSSETTPMPSVSSSTTTAPTTEAENSLVDAKSEPMVKEASLTSGL